MKISLSTILFILLLISCKKRNHKDNYNLSFENANKDSIIGWNRNNGINIATLDSEAVKSGHYSAVIQLKENKPNVGLITQSIIRKYHGDSITLTGYIKTENVTDGFAGLYLNIMPQVAFSNMYSKNLKGTTDWTLYKITLPLNVQKMEGLAFGGIVFGKGKMWIDDLTVSIDGKNISDVIPMDEFPADKDHEFDKTSLVQIKNLDNNTINTLYQVGLIWGFLKYNHPNLFDGKYNWDYALFRQLPKILNTNTTEKDEVISKWIDTLGNFDAAKNINGQDSIAFKPDLGWIMDSHFTEKLKSQLLKIQNANREGNDHYYFAKGETSNIIFPNEKSYWHMQYPDAGFRLLALYRYWNMVQYFFPSKYLIGEDWKNVLKKYIPKFINAKNELEYKLAIVELCGEIHDSHAFVSDATYTLYNYEGSRYLPIKVQFINNKPVVFDFSDKNLAEKDDWQKGDILTKINGQSISSIIKKLARYTPASNSWTQLRDIAPRIVRTNDSIVQVETVRDNKKITKSAASYTYIATPNTADSTSKPYKWLSKEIGYVDNGKLKSNDLPLIFKQFEKAKGIIIDIRNYPSDYLVYKLPDYLLAMPKAFVKFLIPQIKNPGSFYFMDPFETGSIKYDHYAGKIVLLINETTQSSAEYHTMAYRTYPKCLVIGSNSAGADGNVSEIIFPGNIKTRFSGIGVFYPDGTPTQRIGIVPDIIVKPTIQGIKDGKDEILEKAISILSK